MPRGAIRAAPRMPMRIIGAESRMTPGAAAHCRARRRRGAQVTKVALIGATGRMGTAIIRACAAEGSLEIVAAIASAGSKSLGRDAGDVAGTRALGVRVLGDLPPDLAHA